MMKSAINDLSDQFEHVMEELKNQPFVLPSFAQRSAVMMHAWSIFDSISVSMEDLLINFNLGVQVQYEERTRRKTTNQHA